MKAGNSLHAWAVSGSVVSKALTSFHSLLKPVDVCAAGLCALFSSFLSAQLVCNSLFLSLSKRLIASRIQTQGGKSVPRHWCGFDWITTTLTKKTTVLSSLLHPDYTSAISQQSQAILKPKAGTAGLQLLNGTFGGGGGGGLNKWYFCTIRNQRRPRMMFVLLSRLF